MTRAQRANNAHRSRPGRDFREIPGTGGGRRVVADPGGSRAARRAHQRGAGRHLDEIARVVAEPSEAANARRRADRNEGTR